MGTNRKPVIVTCAITGAIHTPTMSEALPYRPEDICSQAVEAANAGAAILHLHARHPETGAVSIKPEHFLRFVPAIYEKSDSIINISTGGSLLNTISERIEPARIFSPELCSLNMGSMNFSMHPLADRFDRWKFDWEESYLRESEGYIFRNTFYDIKQVAHALGGDSGTKFEHECYDVGQIYNLKFCVDQGLFEAPLFIQFVLGILGGIGADAENLIFMKRTADKLFGNNYQWSVLAAGASQFSLATTAANLGGHVRVGLEDSLYISKGRLARSNAEQVMKIRELLEALGHDIATPNQAREMLGLKGRERVNI